VVDNDASSHPHQATSAIPSAMTFHHLIVLWRIDVVDAAQVGVVLRGMWRGSSHMHPTPYFKVSRISLKTLPLYPILFPQYTLDVAYSGWGKKYVPLHLPP
jgi:hypothetical protein